MIRPRHVIAVPDPNVMIVRECVPLRAEFVMRAYLTGVTDTSIWRMIRRTSSSRAGVSCTKRMLDRGSSVATPRRDRIDPCPPCVAPAGPPRFDVTRLRMSCAFA